MSSSSSTASKIIILLLSGGFAFNSFAATMVSCWVPDSKKPGQLKVIKATASECINKLQGSLTNPQQIATPVPTKPDQPATAPVPAATPSNPMMVQPMAVDAAAKQAAAVKAAADAQAKAAADAQAKAAADAQAKAAADAQAKAAADAQAKAAADAQAKAAADAQAKAAADAQAKAAADAQAKAAADAQAKAAADAQAKAKAAADAQAATKPVIIATGDSNGQVFELKINGVVIGGANQGIGCKLVPDVASNPLLKVNGPNNTYDCIAVNADLCHEAKNYYPVIGGGVGIGWHQSPICSGTVKDLANSKNVFMNNTDPAIRAYNQNTFK